MDYYKTQITTFFIKSSFQVITIYNDIKKQVVETTHYLYNEYIYFRTSFDYLTNLYYTFYSKLVSNKVEPFVENWGGVFVIDINNRLYSEIKTVNRNYSIKTLVKANEYADDLKLQVINELYLYSMKLDFNSYIYYHSFEFIDSIPNEIIQTLFFLKTKHIYFSRVVKNIQNIHNFKYLDQNYETVRTPRFFMCVEYTHPEMSNKILIPIEKEYCFVGNEVLSSVFVLKFLEYQPEPYVFDENYVVEVMDNNMNTFTLKNNQFISLKKHCYTVNEL